MVNLLQVTCFIILLSMAYGQDSLSPFVESSFSNFDGTAEVKNKLEGVEPECKTTKDSPKTTTCVKQLIGDGFKYLSKNITVTDDQGNIISQSSSYQSFSSNTMGNTGLSNTDE